MAGNRDDFADWRDRIEARVTTLEVTVGTQARVRAAMDEDLSDVRLRISGQHRLLVALAETQSDHTARLTRLEAGQTALLAGQARLEATTAKLEAGQAKLEAGQARLEAGLAETSAAVKRIIGLLDRDADPGE